MVCCLQCTGPPPTRLLALLPSLRHRSVLYRFLLAEGRLVSQDRWLKSIPSKFMLDHWAGSSTSAPTAGHSMRPDESHGARRGPNVVTVAGGTASAWAFAGPSPHSHPTMLSTSAAGLGVLLIVLLAIVVLRLLAGCPAAWSGPARTVGSPKPPPSTEPEDSAVRDAEYSTLLNS